jgi:hypothetical protein
MMAKLTKRQTKILQYLYDHKSGSGLPENIAKALGFSERDVRSDIRVLQEMNFVSGPPSLLSHCEKTLADLDDKLDATAPEYPAYVVLIASLLSRADEDHLAAELGYDREFVGLVGSRLRNAKIWHDDEVPEVVLSRWKGEGGGIAVWLDMGVAAGTMVCADGDTETPSYTATPEGKRIAERVLGLDRR